MKQAHAEYLTTDENCGYLFYSDVAEHGYGENLYLCYGQADCMLDEGVLESFCESDLRAVTISHDVVVYDDPCLLVGVLVSSNKHRGLLACRSIHFDT